MSIEFWEQPALTYVRTMLARGVSGELRMAERELAGCRAKCIGALFPANPDRVETLQALVYAAQTTKSALASLRRVVEPAASGGALRLLADCGQGLAGLLQTLADAGWLPVSCGKSWPC